MISRPLDPGEAFFFLSDHVSCMNFVVFAQRSALLQTERIAQALGLLQQENALLQVRIEWTEGNGLRFEPAPGHAIELHCHRFDADGWQGWITQELSKPFATGTAPLLRCLYLEDSTAAQSVLALTFHHSIADGRSGTALLRRLLGLLAKPNADPSTATATSAPAPTALPSMAEVYPEQYRWAERPEAAKTLRNVLIGDYRRFGALCAIPWLASEVKAGAAAREPRFLQLRLPASVSQSLRQRARGALTTVHGVLCAAQLLAQHQLQLPDERSTFFLSCPVDMRPYLEPAQPDAPTGLFVSLISNTFQVANDTDIWALARDIINQTRLQIARGEGHLLYWLYGLTGAPVQPSHLEPFSQKALASLPNTMVSNVGAIEPVPEDPAVQAISFALCPMPYQTLFTAASSYQSQLILNIGFDAQRVQPSTAQALAQAMQGYLIRAAGEH